MTSKTRLTVLLVSTPIIVLVLLGGFLNRVLADQDSSYQPLRVFEEVVSLVMNNYVETVEERAHHARRAAGAGRRARRR